MRILAIDTSTRPGSLAIAEQEQVVASIPLPEQKRTTQAFAVALADLLSRSGWTPKQLDRIVVTGGPGSFTGLRIGVTMAKTFAYAVGAELVSINTLELLAHQVPEPRPAQVITVVNAQRGQWFAARWACHADRIDVECPCRVVDPACWLAANAGSAMWTGPGLNMISERSRAGLTLAPEPVWQPQAAALARLAFESRRTMAADAVWQLVPEYFRPSYAEEKRGADTPS